MEFFGYVSFVILSYLLLDPLRNFGLPGLPNAKSRKIQDNLKLVKQRRTKTISSISTSRSGAIAALTVFESSGYV